MIITSETNYDEIEQIVKTNQNINNHNRLIKILKEITIGEIFYGFTAGGYDHYCDDKDEWNKNLFDELSENISDNYIEQRLIQTGYDYYFALPAEETDINNEITICILLSNINGKFNMFTDDVTFGCMLPVLKLDKDGMETFYVRNLCQIEKTIKNMKENGTWKIRKHWYDDLTKNGTNLQTSQKWRKK